MFDPPCSRTVAAGVRRSSLRCSETLGIRLLDNGAKKNTLPPLRESVTSMTVMVSIPIIMSIAVMFISTVSVAVVFVAMVSIPVVSVVVISGAVIFKAVGIPIAAIGGIPSCDTA